MGTVSAGSGKRLVGGIENGDGDDIGLARRRLRQAEQLAAVSRESAVLRRWRELPDHRLAAIAQGRFDVTITNDEKVAGECDGNDGDRRYCQEYHPLLDSPRLHA